MQLHQWRAWPPNAIVPGSEDDRSVDPSRPWQLFSEAGSFAVSPTPPARISEEGANAEEGVAADFGRRANGRRSSRILSILSPSLVSRYDDASTEANQREHQSQSLSRPRSRFSLRFLKDQLVSKSRKKSMGDAEYLPSLHGERTQAQPADWKAYGQWARPRIVNVVVRNATPPPEPEPISRRHVEALMRSVQGAGGSNARPELWIGRVEHPSLPPRPLLWDIALSPPTSSPNTRCLQLNPFLEHRLAGVPPMMFDIRFQPSAIMLGEGEPIGGSASRSGRVQTGASYFFKFEGPNGSQPATFPGVSELDIKILADDMLSPSSFPWPILVRSHHAALPVTVEDVIRSLYDNFHAIMAPEEIECLSRQRLAALERAHKIRVEQVLGIGKWDYLRRVDFLGDRFMFRGLEPTHDGEGFTIFFGPSQ